MSADSSKLIEITHVINPLLFWFKYTDTQNADVETIEQALKKYVSDSGDRLPTAELAGNSYRDESCVTVYLNSKEKWIRAEIDDVTLDQNEVIVWATDYGIPLKKPLDKIVLLSDELKDLCRTTKSAAIKGGIAGIIPASHRINVNMILYFVGNFGRNKSVNLISGEHGEPNAKSTEMGATCG